MTLHTATTIAETRATVARMRAAGKRIALVPTMGALHEGHEALFARAAQVADAVVVSIFVNPLQFGPTEDLARYPRTPDLDLATLERAGVELLFAPSVDEMLPGGPVATAVTAGPAGERLEGAARPHHFDGVLTIVNKLIHIVAPDVVVFGRKDAQQAFVVGRMLQDLNMVVALEVVDTVREADGLARSSRNAYLDELARDEASIVPESLRAAAAAASGGVAAALAAAHAVLSHARVDYLLAVDPATFEPVADGYRGAALVLVAVRIGSVRLIDNEVIRFP